MSNRMVSSLRCACVAFLSIVGSAAMSQSTIQSWSDMNMYTGWVFDPYKTSTNCTITPLAQSTDGNTGPYIRWNLAWAFGRAYAGRGADFVLFTSATWTPTTVPLTFDSVEVSWDLRWQYTTVQAPCALVRQDGKYYIGPTATNPNSNFNIWYSFSKTGIQASEFDEIDTSTLLRNTSSHPNFLTGNTMTFGYVMYTEMNWGYMGTGGGVDIDNWSFRLVGI